MALSIKDFEERLGEKKHYMDMACDKKTLLDVSKSITDWKAIAPHLHLEECDIETITKEEVKEGQKRHVLLIKWHQLRAYKATYKELMTAFLKERRADLAQVLCDYMKDAELDSVPTPCIKRTEEVTIRSGDAMEKSLVSKQRNEVDIKVEDLDLEDLHKECNIECQCERGHECYGDVYKGKWKSGDNLDVIIKIRYYRKRNEWNNSLLLELSRHPNIITLYGIVCSSPPTRRYLHYIFPCSYVACLHNLFCPQGLGGKSEDQREYNFTYDDCLRWAQNIGEGMNHLHSNEILHCNLTSACVWINNRDIAVLSDLSSACHVDKVNEVDVAGTARWRAPELMTLHCIVTKESDVYSYGIVLYELIYKKLPFIDERSIGADFKVSQCKRPDLELEVKTPQYVKNLMESCWNHDIQKRPNFHEITLVFDCQKFPLPSKFFMTCKNTCV